MKKIKRHLTTIVKTLHDTEFIYRQRNNIMGAGTHFLALMFLGSVASALVITYFVQGTIGEIATQLQDHTKTVTVSVTPSSTFAAIGTELPYVFNLMVNDTKTFVYLDTMSEAVIDVNDIKNTHGAAGVIVSSDTIYIEQPELNYSKQLHVKDISKEFGTKDMFTHINNVLVKMQEPKGVMFIFFLFVLASFIVDSIVYLLLIAILAGVIKQVNKTAKLHWDYAHLVTAGLYAITLGYVFNFFFGIVGLLFTSALFLVVMKFVIDKGAKLTGKS